MSLLTARLVADQFKTNDGDSVPGPVPELTAIGLAAGVGLVVWCAGITTNAIGYLLSATAIMTGLIFTMALRFWERSLDARESGPLRFDGDRRAVLDRMRSLLLWTVLAGVVSTTWLATLAVMFGTAAVPVWATAVAASLTLYQLAHVAIALLRLYAASYLLRA